MCVTSVIHMDTTQHHTVRPVSRMGLCCYSVLVADVVKLLCSYFSVQICHTGASIFIVMQILSYDI